MEFYVIARRVDAHGSLTHCKEAEISLDTDLNDRLDAFNPAELLLATVAACMIKNIERVTSLLKFGLRGVDARLKGVRQDAPPRMSRIDHVLTVDTDESERRLELLHENVKKFGTIYNTVAAGSELRGEIRRAP
ncbi:MAG: OsmC family protein [Thiobacillaceae bacterium]